MHRHDEIITVRGGRGIPGFAYTPPRERRFSLGQYIRVDAKLLITPSKPLVIIQALSTATITTTDNQTIRLDPIAFENNADTINIPTAQATRVKGEQRVSGDPLQPSRADGITITINLATANGDVLRLQEHLTWDNKTEAFTLKRDKPGE